jgi:aerobic-type carbon monoxide dehydrogenase small subunit (CoxS/CutS family)
MRRVEASERVRLTLTVNGQKHEVWVPPRKLLSDTLREDCGLTGTHVGCEHGVCGACTVLVDGVAVRSCLLFAVQVEGSDVRTVEGLVDDVIGSALRRAFSDCHALQCGFCTPGILISAREFLANHRNPTEEEIADLLTGHLCRCTGYTSIIRAIRVACEALHTDTSGKMVDRAVAGQDSPLSAAGASQSPALET